MWYPLFLFTVAALCLLWGRRQKPGIWSGSPRTSPTDRPFLWEHEISSHPRLIRFLGNQKRISSRIGISATAPFGFALENERFTHRISRHLNFCTRFLDHAIFIRSDDPRFQRTLQANHELQQKLTKAFAHGICDIRATPAHLIARLKTPVPNPPEANIDTILDALLALKSAIAELPPQPLLQKARQRTAAHVFKRLSAMLFTITFFTLLANLILGYQIIEWEPMWPLWAKSFGLFAGAGFLTLWCLFRHSSYGHEALMTFLRAGLPSAACCLFATLWFVNCQYDTSITDIRRETVLEKYATHSRKNTSHHVRVADWTAHKQTIAVPVTETLYKQLETGQHVRILTHAGALRMQWIARVEQMND